MLPIQVFLFTSEGTKVGKSSFKHFQFFSVYISWKSWITRKKLILGRMLDPSQNVHTWGYPLVYQIQNMLMNTHIQSFHCSFSFKGTSVLVCFCPIILKSHKTNNSLHGKEETKRRYTQDEAE